MSEITIARHRHDGRPSGDRNPVATRPWKAALAEISVLSLMYAAAAAAAVLPTLIAGWHHSY